MVSRPRQHTSRCEPGVQHYRAACAHAGHACKFDGCMRIDTHKHAPAQTHACTRYTSTYDVCVEVRSAYDACEPKLAHARRDLLLAPCPRRPGGGTREHALAAGLGGVRELLQRTL